MSKNVPTAGSAKDESKRAALKIWRYMDLARFTSLMSDRSLYFACLSEFRDPFEGYLPKSHGEAFSAMLQDFVDELSIVRDQVAATLASDADKQAFRQQVDSRLSRLKKATAIAREKIGVSCWHKNEYESEAMWGLYAARGMGVAVESTIGQLREAIVVKDGLIIDDVRYEDFETAPITKGYRHYAGFIKRMSFEHEKELRATLPLKMPGKGMLVPCDLVRLVNRIHISPYAPPALRDTIVAICKTSPAALSVPILQSSLFDAPSDSWSLPSLRLPTVVR